ncbi:tail fiber protein [Mucilaginibacter sp. X5P1]|uniref:tail fiber protein n=1 Tax=Mucilaginibacter sp. X5P1 TaxID=2723088 RepID=UPI001819CBE3|nr:tail fiber protein [Mucilaginibacter sp. X5P1]MBB6137607.1 hypothetical protein [Mucilaginibacter sp. X5P1]
MFALDISDQTTLSFGWANYDASQTIYITSSASLNQITITMTNNTNEQVIFPPGDVYSMLHTGLAGVLYLQFLGQYIPADDVSVMSWAATPSETQWTAAVYSDPEDGTYLAIAPQSQVTIGIGNSITFSLTNVITPDVSSPVQGGTVVFTYAGVSGITNYIAVQLQVPLLNPPDTTSQALAPLVGFAETDLVFIGPEANNLTLYITNSQTTAITLNSQPTAPVFSVSFVFGTGSGALTTVDLSNFSVNMANSNLNNWKVIPNTLGGNPYWQFEPLTTTILGLGVASTAEISIGNIITELVPGVTSVIVAWTGIPGYNDGEVAVDIVKVSPIVVTGFSATPSTISFPTGPQQVTLNFGVLNATFVTVTNTDYAKQTNSSNFNDQTTASITSSTTFTLIASNIYTSQQIASSVTTSVTPDLYSLLPFGTVVMWAGDITSVPAGWALCNGQTVQTPNDGSYIVPNLTDQFVIGAGGTVAPTTNLQGGPDQHTHNITISDQTFQTSTDGTHNHSMTFNTTLAMSSGDTSHYTLYYGNNNGKSEGGGDSNNTQDTSSDGSHTHTVSVGFSNVVSATQNGGINPAWYSLAYIIKIF